MRQIKLATHQLFGRREYILLYHIISFTMFSYTNHLQNYYQHMSSAMLNSAYLLFLTYDLRYTEHSNEAAQI